MEPISMIAGGIAAAGLISSLIGGAQKNSAEERAQLIKQKQMDQWLAIKIPDAKQRKIALQQYVQTGQFTPQLEEAVKIEQTNFERIKTTPEYKQAQTNALTKLREIGEGGLDLTDRAMLNQVQNEAAGNARSRNLQVTDQMARRGALNSGFSLAAQLQGSQQANDMESRAGLDIAAKAQQRALRAISAAGEMGGKMHAQDYAEQKDLATNRDAIADFNARNLQNVQNRNVNRGNEGQKFNLNASQDISNKNTGLANEQEKYNKNVSRQVMEDEFTRQKGASGMAEKVAASEAQRGVNSANTTGAVGQGIVGGLTAYGKYSQGLDEEEDEEDEEDKKSESSRYTEYE